jgi:thymidylate kinase
MFNKSKLVVFVGPDGSGKTTIIENIKAKLSSKYKVKVNHIRFNNIPRAGNLKSFILSIFKGESRRLNYLTKSDLNTSSKHYVYGPKIPLFKIILLLSYEIFDYIFGYLSLYNSKNDSIILFDRYLYDYYTEKDWSNTPLWLMNFFSSLAPGPEYIFFMENSPQEINKRKNELSIEDIDIVNKRTRELLARKVNFVPLNTNNSPDELAEIVFALLAEKNINV